jgi:hypothetical protein
LELEDLHLLSVDLALLFELLLLQVKPVGLNLELLGLVADLLRLLRKARTA